MRSPNSQTEVRGKGDEFDVGFDLVKVFPDGCCELPDTAGSRYSGNNLQVFQRLLGPSNGACNGFAECPVCSNWDAGVELIRCKSGPPCDLCIEFLIAKGCVGCL